MLFLFNNITLRTVSFDDLTEVARMWEFETGEISLERAEKVVTWMQENHQKNNRDKIEHLCLAIFNNQSNKIIGWCGLDGRYNEETNLFYLLDKDYRNQGIAKQCANKLLEYAFNDLNLKQINGACAKENVASYKILEKIGMTLVKEDEKSYYYLMTKEQYEMKE